MSGRSSRTLTVEAVRKLAPPENGRIEIRDSRVTGLCLRVTNKGVKSWSLFYRFEGRNRRMTLGKWPLIDLSEARDQARDALEVVRGGNDPAINRRFAQQPRSMFPAVAEIFVQRYAMEQNRSWRETERIFKVYVTPKWRTRSLDSITRTDVAELLDKVEDRNGVAMARAVLAQIRKLFNWAVVDRGILDHSPIPHGFSRTKPKSRDRYLEDNEILELWKATDEVGYPWAPLFRLLLITGQRRGEVAEMTWNEIKEDLWTIPGDKAKNGKEHLVPLSELAVETIKSIPHRDDFVFSTKPGRPVSGFSKGKARIDGIVNIETPWRLHDLRRTARTGLSKLGVSREVAEAVLNHSPPGLVGVYDKYSFLKEKRDALKLWSAHLRALIPPPSGGEFR